jgi:hypothetical protein
MATDYDAPRKTEEDLNEESIEELKTHRSNKQSAVVDEDEAEAAEGFELPGADLSGEELMVRVLPAQADEFTCASCFLVRHRSQVAREKDGLLYCKDCEGSQPGLRCNPGAGAERARSVPGRPVLRQAAPAALSMPASRVSGPPGQ